MVCIQIPVQKEKFLIYKDTILSSQSAPEKSPNY